MTEALIRKRATSPIVSAGGMTVEYLATSDLSDDAIGNHLLTLAARAPGAGNRRTNMLDGSLYSDIDGRKAAVNHPSGRAVKLQTGGFCRATNERLIHVAVVHAFFDHNSAVSGERDVRAGADAS